MRTPSPAHPQVQRCAVPITRAVMLEHAKNVGQGVFGFAENPVASLLITASRWSTTAWPLLTMARSPPSLNSLVSVR